MTTKIAYSNIAASTLAVLGGPKIATIAYPGTETATDTQGGETITLTGTGFNAGASVIVNGQTAGVVTVISSTQVTFTAPAQSAGTYAVYLVNTDGGTAIAVPGLSYSGTPAWTTSAGSLGNLYETGTIAQSLVATGDAPIVYSVVSGTLPPGSTLSSSGQLSGTSQAVASATTYNFTVQAKDAQNQPTNRAFSVTINPDVVVWSSPAADSVNILAQGVANTVTLAATAASGQSVSYAADTLPTGMSISGNTVTGTPTTAGTTSSTITATSAVTSKSATRTFSWSVTVSGDTYFAYNALLLNGETAAKPFNSDASLNASEIAVFGDTRPNNFNPYQSGYYSNSFNGGGEYLTAPSSAALNLIGDFTVECWAYATATTNAVDQVFSYGNYTLMLYHNGTTWTVEVGNGGSNYFSLAGNASLNAWHHFAITRNANTYTFWVDGVQAATNTNAGAPATSGATLYIGRSGTSNIQWFTGYISNFRVVKGTAVYTTAFTPSTTALTAITNTVLLTCQSPRFVDNGPNNFTIGGTNTQSISYLQPFGTPTTVNVPSYYSTKFNGSTDYLLAPSSTSLALGTGDFTIEAWVYLNSVSGTQGVYTSIDNTNDSWAGVTLGFSGTSFIATSYISSADTITHQTTVSTGQWYHLAVVRNGSSTKSYLNGVQSAGTTSGNYNLTQSGSTIGSYYPGSSPLNGCISNLRVVKGTAVYTANFTPPTQPLIAISGTSLLTCQNSTLIDNSTNAFAITSAGSAQPVTTTPFTQVYTQQTVSNYGAAYFDGSGDYLSVPASTALVLNGDFTIECWVYTSTLSGNQGIIASSGQRFGLIRLTNYFYWLGSTDLSGSSITINANTWYHVAVSRSGSTFKMFVNGVMANSGTYSEASISNIWYIGSDQSNEVWNGYISNVRVVKGTALYTSNFAPPAQPLTAIANTSLLTCQYNQGSNNSQFLDSGNYSQPIARNGNPTQGSFAPFGANWSNYFEGSSSYLEMSSSTEFALGTGDFTIEAWIYPLAYGGSSAGAAIFGTSGGSASGYSLNLGESQDRMRIISNASGNWADNMVVSTGGGAPLNTWSHIAWVRNGNSMTIYKNGTSVATMTGVSAYNFTSPANKGYVGFWWDGYSTRYFNGYISNLRVVKGTAVYTSSFTPSTIPLTPVTNTVLMTSQSPSIIDNSVNSFAITSYGTPSVQRLSPFSNYFQTPISYAVKFTGSVNDYIDVASNALLGYGTGEFEISFWYYATSASGYLFDQRATQPQAAPAMYYDSGSIIYYNNGGIAITGTDPSKNAWHYLTLSRVSGTTRLFVDGSQIGSNYNDTSNYGTLPLRIGCRFTNTADVPYSGYISNFRIVKGSGVSSQTVPTAPLTAISGTSLLTCQDATFKDNSTNAFTITTGGTPKPKTVNPFGYTTSSLQAYSPAVYGTSTYLNGSSYLSIASNSTLSFGTNDFTIEFWMYPTAAFSTSRFLSTYLNGWVIYNNNAGNLVWEAYGVATKLTSTSVVPLNSWTHVVVTRVSGTVYLYLNGVFNGSATDTASYSNTGLLIGSDSGIYKYTGFVANLRIINGVAAYRSSFVPSLAPVTAITNTSLLLNGTAAGIYDYSMMNDLETVGNTQLAPQQPYAGSYYSNYFNGSTDYVQVPASSAFAPGTGDFTVEGWFNVTGTLPNFGGVIYAQTVSGTNYFVITAGNDAGPVSANYISLLTTTSGGGTPVYSNSSNPFTLNTWNHFAVVRSSGMVTVYLNGIGGTPTSRTIDLTNTSYLPTIGRTTHSGQYFPGYISNLRYVKGTAVYTSNFTPSTAPLTAISGTSLLTCQSNQFKDNSTNAFTLTASGTPKVQIFNPFANSSGQSIYFDGSGDYLNIPVTQSLQLGSNNFTIEFWLYVPTLPSARNNITYLNANTSGYAAISLQITSSNKLGLSISESGSSWKYDDATTGVGSALTAGTWQHVAVVRNGQNVQIYLNGTAQGSAYALTSATTSLMTSYTLNQLGVYNSGYNYLNGYLDDFRITNGYARYTSNFTVPTTTLLVK